MTIGLQHPHLCDWATAKTKTKADTLNEAKTKAKTSTKANTTEQTKVIPAQLNKEPKGLNLGGAKTKLKLSENEPKTKVGPKQKLEPPFSKTG